MNKAEEFLRSKNMITGESHDFIIFGKYGKINLNEIMDEYAQQSREDFANYIEEHYQEGDGDTISIHDWLFKFNHQNQER